MIYHSQTPSLGVVGGNGFCWKWATCETYQGGGGGSTVELQSFAAPHTTLHAAVSAPDHSLKQTLVATSTRNVHQRNTQARLTVAPEAHCSLIHVLRSSCQGAPLMDDADRSKPPTGPLPAAGSKNKQTSLLKSPTAHDSYLETNKIVRTGIVCPVCVICVGLGGC